MSEVPLYFPLLNQGCAILEQLPLAHSLRSQHYRGTSIIRNSAPLGPYSRNMPKALWWS